MKEVLLLQRQMQIDLLNLLLGFCKKNKVDLRIPYMSLEGGPNDYYQFDHLLLTDCGSIIEDGTGSTLEPRLMRELGGSLK